jgi:HK97 family phage prohead protease/HK97 family phage major capsid protein
MILTFSSQVEASDSERRVISGKIVPFEEAGNTSVGKVVFAKGSIEIGDPGKVKMLMQHRPEKPIGRMQKFQQAEDGIYASFKISASMQGQDALILASEQLVDGLSVGVDVNKSIQKKDYLYVTSATLREVSLVESPAFTAAQYTEHKIKAALGSDESKLFIAAADDSFSTNPAFNPTQYLSEFVTNTRFGTPAIDACSQGTLPSSGMTISVPSLVTSAGGQSGVAPVVTVEAEAGAVQNTGMVTQYLTGTVSKYSGMNTLSVELLERSDPNFYAELTTQLQNAYLSTIDTAVLTALIAAGTGATATTADSAGIIAFSSEAATKIYQNTGYFAQNYLANPAQWSGLLSAVDNTGRPIYNALQPMNAAGDAKPSSIRGNVLGLDLFVDKHFTETTFDDGSAIILAPEAFTVYRSPQAYMSVNVVSNLQVQVAIYGFMATIAKMPKGIYLYNKS